MSFEMRRRGQSGQDYLLDENKMSVNDANRAMLEKFRDNFPGLDNRFYFKFWEMIHEEYTVTVAEDAWKYAENVKHRDRYQKPNQVEANNSFTRLLAYLFPSEMGKLLINFKSYLKNGRIDDAGFNVLGAQGYADLLDNVVQKKVEEKIEYAKYNADFFLIEEISELISDNIASRLRVQNEDFSGRVDERHAKEIVRLVELQSEIANLDWLVEGSLYGNKLLASNLEKDVTEVQKFLDEHPEIRVRLNVKSKFESELIALVEPELAQILKENWETYVTPNGLIKKQFFKEYFGKEVKTYNYFVDKVLPGKISQLSGNDKTAALQLLDNQIKARFQAHKKHTKNGVKDVKKTINHLKQIKKLIKVQTEVDRKKAMQNKQEYKEEENKIEEEIKNKIEESKTKQEENLRQAKKMAQMERQKGDEAKERSHQKKQHNDNAARKEDFAKRKTEEKHQENAKKREHEKKSAASTRNYSGRSGGNTTNHPGHGLGGNWTNHPGHGLGGNWTNHPGHGLGGNWTNHPGHGLGGNWTNHRTGPRTEHRQHRHHTFSPGSRGRGPDITPRFRRTNAEISSGMSISQAKAKRR